MYARAFLMLAGVTTTATGLPYFHRGTLDIIGLPIQWFGVIVAAGVLIGATPLRRYAEWHGVSDEHIRGLLTWVMISGFLGAHEFDVVAYQWGRLSEPMNTPAGWWPGFLPSGLWPSNWPLVIRIWDGISSYGGFIGGAIGFAVYVWWKRLPVRLFADITIVGLLPAFSIGRIGCTVVSDHIGAKVDVESWYSFLAMDYPRKLNPGRLAEIYPGTSEFIRAWNLGLVEFLYLVPVNIVILWLAFRPSKRMPAGFITVLTGLLYAPVRFFLDFLRPADTDPPLWGLTFAQWSSILAFAVALYAGRRILQTGAPAEPVTRTSREAQERLKVILREDDDAQKQPQVDRKAEAERKKAEIARLRAERDREDAEIEAAERAKALAGKAAVAADAEDDDDAGEGDAVEAEAAVEASASASAGAKPAAGKSGGAKAGGSKAGGAKSGGGKKQNKNRKR